MEESWVDLFLLSLAQWDVEIDLHVMLKAAGIDKENRTTGEIMGAIADLNHLQNVVNKFKSLQLDSTEYACLKAISLFKPGKIDFQLKFKFMPFLGGWINTD